MAVELLFPHRRTRSRVAASAPLRPAGGALRLRSRARPALAPQADRRRDRLRSPARDRDLGPPFAAAEQEDTLRHEAAHAWAWRVDGPERRPRPALPAAGPHARREGRRRTRDGGPAHVPRAARACRLPLRGLRAALPPLPRLPRSARVPRLPSRGPAGAPAEAPSVRFPAGYRIGHATDARRLTGCTVILPPPGTIAAVDVRGGAPGTRETGLFTPGNLISEIDALVFAGGSAFGLAAATGVTEWLAERGVGPDRRPDAGADRLGRGALRPGRRRSEGVPRRRDGPRGLRRGGPGGRAPPRPRPRGRGRGRDGRQAPRHRAGGRRRNRRRVGDSSGRHDRVGPRRRQRRRRRRRSRDGRRRRRPGVLRASAPNGRSSRTRCRRARSSAATPRSSRSRRRCLSSPARSSAWRSRRTTASPAPSARRTRSSTATSSSPSLPAAAPPPRPDAASRRRRRRPRGGRGDPRRGAPAVTSERRGPPPRRRGGSPLVDRRHRHQGARRASARDRVVPVGLRGRRADPPLSSARLAMDGRRF